MRCDDCGLENRDGVHFCEECGTRLAPKCPACGAAVPLDRRFCGACGRPLTAPDPPTSAFPTPDRYTPQHLARRILRSREAIEGERKHITVLFADIRARWSCSAIATPRRCTALLDPVLTHMMDAVHRYEGTVNQVLGDGIMALFGAPVAHEDHAVRACYAALRCRKRQAVSESSRRSAGARCRSGSASTRAKSSCARSARDLRMDYTAVGPDNEPGGPYGTARRPGQIFSPPRHAVSSRASSDPAARTAAGQGTRAADRSLRADPVRAVPARMQAAAVRGLTPSSAAGRSWRRSAAAARWPRRARPDGSAGRRARRRKVAARSRSSSRPSRHGLARTRDRRPSSYGRPAAICRSMDLFNELLPDRRATTSRADSGEGRAEGLEALVARWCRGFATRCRLASIPVDEPEMAGARALPRDDSERSTRPGPVDPRDPGPAVELGGGRPALGRRGDAEAPGQSGRGIRPPGRAALVTYRPEYQHGWGDRSYYTQFPIEPLPAGRPKPARGICWEPPRTWPISSGFSSSGQKAIRSSSRSACATWSRRARSSGERGAYQRAGATSKIEVPPTVQSVLAARIDRLPVAERQLLQAAAVIGKGRASRAPGGEHGVQR